MPAAWTRLALCALACAQTVAALCSQQSGEQRRPTFCRVVDDSGAPLAGAEVCFVGGLPHLGRSVAPTDVQRVATDSRGRAIAKLREDLCYLVWAVGPAFEPPERDESALTQPMRAAGEHLVAPAQGYFSAGALLELRCTLPRLPLVLRLTGLDAWREHGPLRLFAITPLPGDEFELQCDEHGRVVIPPGESNLLEVRLPDGSPLWTVPFNDELQLPPPTKVQVHVVDEKGAPLADAEVEQRVARLLGWSFDGFQGVGEERMRRLGKTGPDGRCEVVVPYAGDPLQEANGDLLLMVHAPGRPEVAGGILNRTLYVDDHRVPKFEGDALRFTCPKLPPLVGFVPGAPGGTVAHLGAVCKLHMQANSYMHDPRVYTAEIDAGGHFVMDGVPAGLHSCLLSFVPPEGSAWQPPQFPPQPERALPPEVVPPADGVPMPFGFGVSELRVLDVNGGPALGAVAFVTPSDRRGVLTRDGVRRVPLGSRGDAHLHLLPGSWVVVVVNQRSFGVSVFDVAVTGAEVALQLQPMATMVVVLTDRDGKPVVGAQVRQRGTSSRGTDDPAQTILQSLRRSSRALWEGLRSDDAGHITIPFLPVEGVQQRLDLRWDTRTSEEFTLEPEAEIGVHEKR